MKSSYSIGRIRKFERIEQQSSNMVGIPLFAFSLPQLFGHQLCAIKSTEYVCKLMLLFELLHLHRLAFLFLREQP